MCHICGLTGHYARDCTFTSKSDSFSNSVNVTNLNEH